ncbi:hypothetical protein MCUN1_003040 [Malassezia cuniculi]|uniref:IPT/TIG domain-containing protein n=1 Tax=Malassezia cuniculi TaxID=948313 RepID=A0AAF0J7W9_9BASI|nr:hypothetical protein MCUN1_003040 [Malassezia cuniculi]
MSKGESLFVLSPTDLTLDDYSGTPASCASTPTPPSLTSESSPESVYLYNDDSRMSDFDHAPYLGGGDMESVDDGFLRKDDIQLLDDRLEPAWASDFHSDVSPPSKSESSAMDMLSPAFSGNSAAGIHVNERVFDTIVEPETCAPPSAFETRQMTPPAEPDSDVPDFPLTATSFIRPSRDALPKDLELLIHGIPMSGAKSRVETQIRMHLELVRRLPDGSCERIGSFSHIKVPPLSGTKRKSRKYQPPNVPPESVLQLEATVVTSRPPHTRVYVCDSCRERERKRAHRRKGRRVNPVIQATPDEMRALGIDPESPNAAELASNAMEEEERKHAVLFNCGDYINFSDGAAVLSTRITCYCRHHQEKVGFCIVFVLRNSHGEFVATQTTPPIMIMDDHKSSAGSAIAKRERVHQVDGSTQDEPSVRMRPYDDAARQQRSPTSFVIDPTSFVQNTTPILHTMPPEPVPAPMPAPVPAPVQLNQFFHEIDSPVIEPSGPAPVINKLIPSEGPVTGGIEITILGENFAEGITCFFGDTPSSMTRVWANSTLVCLLPPSMQAGSVPVTLCATGMPPVASMDNMHLFTYVDATDRALMELALQVVGLQMTGQMTSARDIAMRIVGSRSSGGGGSTMQPQNMQHSLMNLISLADDTEAVETKHTTALAACNKQGHTLLHLAAACGFDLLVEDLATRGAALDALDRGGYTPLHLAALAGHVDVVQVLLRLGASPLIEAYNGDLALDCARRSKNDDVEDLLDGATAGEGIDQESESESETLSATSEATSEASITFSELAEALRPSLSESPTQRSTAWGPLGFIAPLLHSPGGKRSSKLRNDDSSDEESSWRSIWRNRLPNVHSINLPRLSSPSPPQLLSPLPSYDEAMLADDFAISQNIDGEKVITPGIKNADMRMEQNYKNSLGIMADDAYAHVNAAVTRDPIFRVRPSVRDDHMLLLFWIPALVLVIGVSLFVSFSPTFAGEHAVPFS